MRRAVAVLIRNGHAEAYRYGWNFFSECVEELSGEPYALDLDTQDEWLKEMGVLNGQ